MKAKKYLFFSVSLLFFLTQNTYATAVFDGADYPVGKPEATGYYDAQDFGKWNEDFQGNHLGEDWNEQCGGDCDLGEPVYSMANGIVADAKYYKGWGNIVLIDHAIGSGTYLTLSGHLNSISVSAGQFVARGQQIGTIGKGDRNKFSAHLHYELRSSKDIGIGTGYARNIPPGYLNPHEFISSHRPIKPSVLSVLSVSGGKVKLSWAKVEDNNFDKYEIYRSSATDGTLDSSKRTLVYSGSDISVLEYTDNPSYGTYYYRIFNYSKSGLVTSSNEVTSSVLREYMNITNQVESQQYPVIDGNIVTWQDNRTVNRFDPNYLYYYDIAKGEGNKINIQLTTLKSNAQMPHIKGKYVIYSAQDSSFNSTGTNIYAVNLETGNAFLVTSAIKDQITPVVSDDGIAVWADLRNGTNLDLWYLDLKTAEGEKPLVQAPGNQIKPRIWGSKVVWKDSRANTKYDLYIKDLVGGTETVLATTVGDGAPDIWENWVVWEYSKKVSLINTVTKEIKVLAAANAGPSVRVWDNKVVYSVQENSSYYIHIYDIETGVDTKLDFAISNYPNVGVSGDHIVFDRLEPNTLNTEIYLTEI